LSYLLERLTTKYVRLWAYKSPLFFGFSSKMFDAINKLLELLN